MKKLFVIRKYLMAKSAEEAIKLEKNVGVGDCWIDEEWKSEQINNNKIGFLNESKRGNKKGQAE